MALISDIYLQKEKALIPSLIIKVQVFIKRGGTLFCILELTLSFKKDPQIRGVTQRYYLILSFRTQWKMPFLP